MKTVHFELLAEHIDFDGGDYNVEIESIKEYSFKSKEFSFKEIEELFIKLIKIKGDWITHEINENNGSVYANITLLYPYFDGVKNSEVPKEIITITDDFISKKTEIDKNLLVNEELEIDSKDADGLLISIDDHTFEDFEILEELRKNNIEFEIITDTKRRTETGAGDLFVGLILFIKGTVISGIAWDIIKGGIIKGIQFPERINEMKVENINYKHLLKSVSLRSKIHTRNLILLNSSTKGNESKFIFRGMSNIITVICDKNGFIKEYNLEPYKAAVLRNSN
jgi:hypothetical protein